jgi:hypothetical protein
MKRGRFFYITGCDGTGKTTQADLLLSQLKSRGIKARKVWLRYPFYFSIPFLAYSRLRGFSWYEEIDGYRHGYWDFRGSWMMVHVFPWFLFLDSLISAMFYIYLPRLF